MGRSLSRPFWFYPKNDSVDWHGHERMSAFCKTFQEHTCADTHSRRVQKAPNCNGKSTTNLHLGGLSVQRCLPQVIPSLQLSFTSIDTSHNTKGKGLTAWPDSNQERLTVSTQKQRGDNLSAEELLMRADLVDLLQPTVQLQLTLLH